MPKNDKPDQVENEEIKKKEQEKFFKMVMGQVAEDVKDTLVREVNDSVQPIEGTSAVPAVAASYAEAVKQLKDKMNNPDHNNGTYQDIHTKVRKSVQSTFNTMADKPLMKHSNLEELKSLITENVMGMFKGGWDPDHIEPGLTAKEAADLIKDKVSTVLKQKPSGLQDRIKDNLKKLLEEKPITEGMSEKQRKDTEYHNQYASDMKKLWRKKIEEEDAMEAAKSAPPAPKKKKDEDAVDEHGPSKPMSQQNSQGKPESLPEQLWSRAMYEDKTILMALALDIFLLIPIMFVSFLGRWGKYGFKHAALMTAGLEKLQEDDPAMDVFLREQIGIGHPKAEHAPEQSEETTQKKKSGDSPETSDLLKAGIGQTPPPKPK